MRQLHIRNPSELNGAGFFIFLENYEWKWHCYYPLEELKAILLTWMENSLIGKILIVKVLLIETFLNAIFQCFFILFSQKKIFVQN